MEKLLAVWGLASVGSTAVWSALVSLGKWRTQRQREREIVLRAERILLLTNAEDYYGQRW